jgi:DNA polymerase-1
MREGLRAFYGRFGFKTGCANLKAAPGRAAPAGDAAPAAIGAAAPIDRPRDYETITTWERLEHWLQRCKRRRSGRRRHRDRQRWTRCARASWASALRWSPGARPMCRWPTLRAGAPEQLPLQAVLDAHPALAGRPGRPRWARTSSTTACAGQPGIAVRGYAHDTLLQSYVLEAHKTHGLEALAERHLGRKGLSYEDLCGKGANQIPFSQVDVASATEYSGEDSEMTLQVHQTLWPQLQADAGLRLSTSASRCR